MDIILSPAPAPQWPRLLEALYGAPAGSEDIAALAASLQGGWMATRQSGSEAEFLGAVGLRPSPAHGSELVGGALLTSTFPDENHRQVARLLVEAALESGPVYAFAEPSLLPYEALSAAGLRELGAYRLLAGETPQLTAPPPAGMRLLPLREVQDVALLVAALQAYEDRIGHHAVQPEAVRLEGGGYDLDLSVLALDAQGRAAGLCRAACEEGYARIDSPAVRPDLRASPLRRALLAAVLERVRAVGFGDVALDSWGDTAEELAHDLSLGLSVELENPILGVS